MSKKQIDEVPINGALLNSITPIGMEFKQNTIIVGESSGRVYGIVKYPQTVDYGWLSRLTNIPSTIASITFTPVDDSAFLESLSNTIRQKRGEADSAKDRLVAMRAERAAEDAEKMIIQVDQHGEKIGAMSVLIAPITRDEKLLKKVCQKVESAIAVARCKGRVLSSLQKEGFKQMSPFYSTEYKIEQITQRILPLSSFIGGFPFAASGLNDGEGYYFGKDNSGGLIVIDPWKRGGDRTNSNMVIMGVAGVGKSTTIKHIILSEYMRGTKILIIDPESEYKELCKNLHGDWINCGGGSKGRINPLQIRPVPTDDEDEAGEHLFSDEGNGMGDMALHMKTLEIFFNLYKPSLTDMHTAALKLCLIDIYNKFGIFWDTDISSLKNENFPIFTNLFEVIEVRRDKEENQDIKKIYIDLSFLLYDIVNGSDQFLWNGHTTISTQTRCVCLDTHDLQNTSDSIKRTQYFTVLQWCWEQMSRDREERVLLISDEAYLMIDPNVPQSLVFLRNVEKRARKYEAAVAIISHSVVDFLDPSIKMYGQALLDIPCIKILMGTDGK
ncbi:MAG TPA: ATP-binding protein, partial [Ruminiclostridium sp.]